MLKQRVITALVLLPLVMVLIFAVSEQWFLIILGAVLLGGSWEYTKLAGLSRHSSAYILVLIQATILGLLFISSDSWSDGRFLFLGLSCLAWLLMFVRLLVYQQGDQLSNSYRALSFITAIVSVTTGWFALCWLRTLPQGTWLILLLLLIVWAADTGAYFFGKAFGKRKLAPQISPGKTQMGLLGGLITAPLVALLALKLMPLAPIEPLRLVLITLIVALVSVGGDLLISMHKRTSGFKDSGVLLPGHGGILDRLDSLLAAGPFFALGLLVSGI